MFEDLQGQVTDIAAALAAANAAQTAADDAATDAATAQTTANTANTNAAAVKLADKITGSYTVPADVVTAADVGTDVTITIAAHTRIYGDGTQLSVAGGTLTGKAFSTLYGIYYTDTTTSDTTPTYVATTNPTVAQNMYVNGRHRVAVVETPADGSPPATGGGTPPGGGGDHRDWYTIP
jgi:hypothetical protein